jgi:hypothetical protein
MQNIVDFLKLEAGELYLEDASAGYFNVKYTSKGRLYFISTISNINDFWTREIMLRLLWYTEAGKQIYLW